MKKAKTTKPHLISKQAYQVAKSMGSETRSKSDTSQSASHVDIALQQELLRKFEAEVMGEQGQAASKSDMRAKNLEQMVTVLHQRLQSLEVVAKTRKHLCSEDMNANSESYSEQAPKITDGFEEINTQKLPKEIKFTSAHRDNLVSSESVFIDANHLVVKTKATTETGKKLEVQLEESFGATSLRELKGKKVKPTRVEKSKRTAQQKTEEKKQLRQKLERDLHTNMENYVTRSVNDADLKFKAPLHRGDEADWPISIKWPSENNKSQRLDNIDGEMDPELLLRYAVERIYIPSGEKLFRWLVRQSMMQEYFVFLFWSIKLKFFQPDCTGDDETYLLHKMSAEYIKLVELISRRAKAENEKDFAYKYIPCILANAVYFGFFFLCPGSRHIYTKAFRKTVFMQVVKIMHGVQLHPLSVKVTWAKLFPEEVQDGEDEMEEAGEIFPVQLAFSKKLYEERQTHSFNTARSTGGAVDTNDNNDLTNTDPHTSPLGGVAPRGGLLETDEAIFIPIQQGGSGLNGSGSSPKGLGLAGANTTPSGGIAAMGVSGKGSLQRMMAMNAGLGPSQGTLHASKSAPGVLGGSTIPTEGISASPRTNANTLSNSASTKPGSLDRSLAVSRPVSRPRFEDTRMCNTGGGTTSSMQKTFSLPAMGQAFTRTGLDPLPERPHNIKAPVVRQNKEHSDAKGVSPLIQQFLYSDNSEDLRATQPMGRTVPISWCVAGGSDTHRRRPVPKELHDELSHRVSKVEKEFRKETVYWRNQKVKSVHAVDRACATVLSSGPQAISRFSLDLVKQQRRLLKGPGGGKEAPVATGLLDEVPVDPNSGLEKYFNYQDEDLEEFLKTI